MLIESAYIQLDIVKCINLSRSLRFLTSRRLRCEKEPEKRFLHLQQDFSFERGIMFQFFYAYHLIMYSWNLCHSEFEWGSSPVNLNCIERKKKLCMPLDAAVKLIHFTWPPRIIFLTSNSHTSLDGVIFNVEKGDFYSFNFIAI